MSLGRMLDLWPLTNVRKLAKQLRMQPSQLMRRVGWTKNKRRYYLELKQPLPELEAGTYMTPSLAMCMVPATIASAVAEERGVRTRLVNPDPPPLAPTAASAAGSTPVIAVLAHVDHGKTTLLDKLMGTNVAAGEVGLITQSVRPALLPLDPPIGGFSQLAFIDTPGHQALRSMLALTLTLTLTLALTLTLTLTLALALTRRSARCAARRRRAPTSRSCSSRWTRGSSRRHARWCAAARGAGSRWCSS